MLNMYNSAIELQKVYDSSPASKQSTFQKSQSMINPCIRKPESSNKFHVSRKFKGLGKSQSGRLSTMINNFDDVISHCESVKTILKDAKFDLRKTFMEQQDNRNQLKKTFLNKPAINFQTYKEYQRGKKAIASSLEQIKILPQSQKIVKSILVGNHRLRKSNSTIKFEELPGSKTAELLQINKRDFGGKFNPQIKVSKYKPDSRFKDIPKISQRNTLDLLMETDVYQHNKDLLKSRHVFEKYLCRDDMKNETKQKFKGVFDRRVELFKESLFKTEIDLNANN